MNSVLKLIAVLSLLGNFFGSSLLKANTAEDVVPLLIGATVPSVSVESQQGESIDLASVLKGKYSVVIFYRGSWCPYCNTHLSELASIEDDLKDRQFKIVAISPDSPESLNVTDAKHDLGYELYSDRSYSAMNAFGVAYDHPRKGKLPVPAVFLITPDLQISFQYVNPNYRFRIPASLLLAAADSSKP